MSTITIDIQRVVVRTVTIDIQRVAVAPGVVGVLSAARVCIVIAATAGVGGAARNPMAVIAFPARAGRVTVITAVVSATRVAVITAVVSATRVTVSLYLTTLGRPHRAVIV